MAVPYLPAQRAVTREIKEGLPDDVLYWRRIQQLAVFKEPSAVTSVAISPQAPYCIASTSSVRLSLTDSVICEPIDVMSRFKQAVYGAKFRNDGHLLAIGGEEGKARIFDVSKSTGLGKAPVRSFRASPTTVRAVLFTASGKDVISLADDGFVKLWNLASSESKPISEWSAHNDSIRCGAASRTQESLFVTGGYDHTVKLWDSRTSGECSLEMKLDAPVEAILLYPNDRLVAIAYGNNLRICDVSYGGRILATPTVAHYKTITSLVMANSGEHLLSADIGRRINVFRTMSYSLCHSFSMPSPVISMDISPDDETLAIGMTSIMAIYKRAPVKNEIVASSMNLVDKRSIHRLAAPPVTMELKDEEKKKFRLGKIDAMLKKFQHAYVIRTLFQSSNYICRPDIVAGYLRVILFRNALHRAMAGQSSQVYSHIFKFLSNNLFKSDYFFVLRHVNEAIFDVISEEDPDKQVLNAAKRLKQMIAKEVQAQKHMTKAIGSLEMIISNSRRKLPKPAENHASDPDQPESLNSVKGEKMEIDSATATA
ncbi:hypothetical protein WR25_14214 [Diploscapter pachys]|uniref:U3 small nucleolar RNA-associated protein 15 homolog n=1 Tax=Diploscapter pachys TaxID=2018661 RepID=A0A2A2LMP2_9BILA|nr:hypothetical protein WR25_14214 [Diploscapter pachys]